MSEIPDAGADVGGSGAAVAEMEGFRVLATTATRTIQRQIATAESRRSRRPVSCCLIGQPGDAGERRVGTWVLCQRRTRVALFESSSGDGG